MNKNQLSESKLHSLWNIIGNKRYSIKRFIKNGKFVSHIVFKDKIENKNVIGKVVGSFSEGEIFHWPNLHHRSLAPLLDIVSLPANTRILITTYKEISLRQIVHDRSFVENQRCFANKKIYMEDVLWGLDYLHRNSLVLMNISDANIGICLESNTAVITDFSCLKSICRAKKCKFDLQPFYQGPEVNGSNDAQSKIETFNPIAAEMWAFGIMAFEVFFQHKVPWALVDYNSSRALEIINYLDLDALKAANKGSILLQEDFIGFKEFLKLFISYYPHNRSEARCAAMAIFLKPSKKRIGIPRNWTHLKNECMKEKVDSFVSLNDLLLRKYHNQTTSDSSQQGNKCTEWKEKGNISIRLNGLSSIKSSQIISKSCTKDETEFAAEKLSKGSSVEMNGLSSTQNSNKFHVSKRILTPKFSGLQNINNCRKMDLNTELSAKASREHLPVAHSCSLYDKTHRNEKVPNIRKVYSFTYPNRNKILDQLKVDDNLDNQISENMSDRQNLHSVSQQESTVSPLPNREIKSMRSHGIPKSELNLDQSASGSFSNKCLKKSKAFETIKSSFVNLSNDKNLQPSDNDAAGKDTLSQTQIYCTKSKSLYLESFRHESCKSYISLRSSSSKHNPNNQKKMKKSSVMFRSAPLLGDFKNTPASKKSDVSISTVSIKWRKSKKISKFLATNENGQSEMNTHGILLSKEDITEQHSTQNKEKTISRTLFGQIQPFELTGKWKKLPEPTIIGSFHCILKNKLHCPVHSKIKSSNSFLHSKEIEVKNSRHIVKCNKRMSQHLYKSGPLSNCYYSQMSENTQSVSPSRVELQEKNKVVNFDTGHYKLSKKNSYKRAIHGKNSPLDLKSTDRSSVNKSQNLKEKHKKRVRKRCFIEIEVVSQKSNKVRGNNRHAMGTTAKELKNERVITESSKRRKSKYLEVKITKRTNLSTDAERNTMQILNNLEANGRPTLGTGTRQLKSEKTVKAYPKQKKMKCHKVKAEENISLQPNDGVSSTIISTRSFAILTAESLDNPEVPETKHKRMDKRMSFKKAALYCLCLGNE